MLPTGSGIGNTCNFPSKRLIAFVPQRAFAEALGAVDHELGAHASE
jgi:hypothetical protein